MVERHSLNRIGIVDYRLDNYHAEVYLEALRAPLAERGYEVVGATALEAEVSRAWADNHGLPYFDDLKALDRHADVYLVLAPSNPELHVGLCQGVLPLGKPTFVDKTFAPDEASAREIFALADVYEVPLQTTSALRSTAVQAFIRDLPTPVQSMIIFCSGTSFAEYGIHPVELAVSCLGHEAERLMRIGLARHPQWLLQFSGERFVTIDFNPTVEVPFSAMISTQLGHDLIEIDGSTLFLNAASSILDFFDAGRPLIDRRETIMVRRILDLAMSDRADGAFVSLNAGVPDHAVVNPPHWNRGTVAHEAGANPGMCGY
jgi:hypothetical protein